MAIQPPVLTLYLDQSEVWAGGTLQLTAVVAHGGPAPEEYVLSIRGVDPAWVTLRPPTLSVEAGGQATATILIAPPADAASAELVLTVRAFAQMSNIVIEATQIALLYSASGAPPVRTVVPYETEPRGLRPGAMWALAAGMAVLVIVVGVLVFFAMRAKNNGVASATCVGKPLQQVDLYSDDLTTAIRIREPDLSNLRVLRTEPAETLSPLFASLVSLSPDGSRIAYVTASNEALDDAHIWSLDVANPSQRQELASVPKGMWVVRPAWSADSKQIAFVRYNDQQAALGQSQLELWIAEVGGQPRKVASPAELRPEGFYGDVSQPLCWSQDNRSVLFSSVTSVVNQGARPTGTARVATTATGPRQVAVNVLTGSTEAVTTVAPVPGATRQPAAGAAVGACGLPPFSQNDPTWRNVIMQSSGDTIGQYGCAVTASAMLLNYYGAILTPPQLSACLQDHADQLAWAGVPGCSNGAVTGSNAFDFSWPNLDQVLATGNPAIVGMARGQTGLHFVIVTAGGGGDAGDYTVMDPWDGTTSKTLQTFFASGYNPRWIRTFAGTDRACARLVATQTPASDKTGVSVATDGALLVPAQLLPIFTKVAGQSGVPREILLAMARVASDFTPRAMGQPIAQNSGTEDERALGMMQFLPSVYRMFETNADAATGRQLGDAGIWDPEASLWAAAFYLQMHGVGADPHTALAGFTTVDGYADLVLRVAVQYRAALIPDDNIYDPNGTNVPGTLAAPNPVNPPAFVSTTGGAQASGRASSGSAVVGGVGTPSGGLTTAGTPASGGSAAASGGATGRAGMLWSVPDASVGRREVQLDVNTANIGEIVSFNLYTLSQSGSVVGPVNQPTLSRQISPGAIIRDDGVYEAVLVTRQDGLVRVSRRKFTIDRTAPRLDVTVSNGLTPPGTGTSGTSTTGGATRAASSATTGQARPATAGLTRLRIGYSDPLSGVAAIEYSLDSGAWQLYFGDVSFKPELFVTAPGNHTVRIRATDLAGNVSTERALDFSVTAAPRAGTVATPPSGTFVPTLFSPTPLAPNATLSGPAASPSAALTTPTVTPVPSATVPLSAIVSTAPGAAPPGGAGAPLPSTPVGAAAGTTVAGGSQPTTATGGTTAAGTVVGAGTPGGSGTTPVAGAGTPAAGATTASGTTTGTTAAGTGTVTGTNTAAPTASATPAPGVHIDAISCPDTLVGNSDTCSLATITNSGAAALTITKAEASGDFSVGDFKSSCGSRLSAGATCQIVVTFSPTTGGSRVGRLTVTDNAPDSPQSIPLSGRGLAISTTPTVAPTPAPAIRIDPVTCPDTLVGTTQQCTLMTITNTSATALPITALSANGEFAVGNNSCSIPLAPGAPCQVVVNFTPTGLAARVGSMTVTFGGAGSPQTVPLHGNGIAPSVSLIPTQLLCPDTHVGQSATCQAVLSNIGTAVLTITSITMTSTPPVFTIPNNACGTTLSPGATCQIPITFAPLINGAYTGTLTVSDNAFNSSGPQLVHVTANGVGGAPAASLTLSTPCPDTMAGHSASCQVTVTNNGTAVLAISSISITPGMSTPTTQPTTFTQSANTCGAGVNPGATCQITITFTPPGVNPLNSSFTATLVVNDNAPGSPHMVTVTGKGI
ncbi:MAG: choice-of-anchor D domain-containing protein [Thermomicrobiales bacterium]